MSRWPWALITGPCRGGPTLLGAFITRGWGVSCHADCVSCYQACSCWEGDVLIAALIPTKHPFMTELAAERKKLESFCVSPIWLLYVKVYVV